MIRLTVNPNANAFEMTFDQKVITIGSGNEILSCDLSLSDSELQPIHIKIVEEGPRFLVINYANDPFVTLNGNPFGKKTLANNDLLEVGSYLIRIEIVDKFKKHEDKKSDPLNDTLEKMIDASQSELVHPIVHPYSSLDQDSDAFICAKNQQKENTIEELDLEDLMREVEQFEHTPSELAKSNPDSKETTVSPAFQKYFTAFKEEEKSEQDQDQIPHSQESPVLEPSVQKKHYHEYHLGEFDDESENWTTEKETKSSQDNSETEEPLRTFNWKLIGATLMVFLLILLLIAGTVYINISAKYVEEELRAAEGVADVAMALKYAHIHHIKSHKKNWSDPEFIKNSLAQVIPHDYPSLAKIDNQGHLNDTSYSLRIYTSTDFSQFLVIAQPAPSVLQWLIPKTAIVIDSKLMQLKKVADMKTLNRLLVNSNNLDNSNAVEVTNLVKRGQLIPLNVLAQRRKSQDFSPPKALTLLRPGSENYIYNAPRYYQLGETIVKRAIDLMDMPGSVYEMSRLKQDMSLLSKMHDMVLYSSDGIQFTLDSQKAIAAFVSNARFLTAYLKFDPQGMIISTHLIIDDESSHYQTPQTEKKQKNRNDQIAEETILSTEPADIQIIEEPPLLKQLRVLCTQREQALKPLKNQISDLFNQDAEHPIDGFETRLTHLLQQYLEEDTKQKQEMAKNIQQLAEEYRLMPIEEFIGYLNKAGLEEGCREILKHAVKNEMQNEKLQAYIDDIKTVEKFTDLEEIVTQVHHWLNLKNFYDLTQLRIAHKLIKIETIQRINKMLLSSMPLPLELHQDEEQRIALQHVLQRVLENAEEQTYYIDEYNNRISHEAF